MSLILEALRKSEAERRRGQTPDLLTDATPATPVAHGPARNWAVPLAAIVAAMFALLLALWWVLRDRAEPALAVHDPAPQANQTAPVAAATPTTGSLSPPVARAPERAAVALVPAPAAATPAPTPSPASTTAVAQVDTPSPPIEPPSEQAAPREPAPPANAPTFASGDVPLKLSDLSPEERQQLPPLKLSMHMWAPAPGDRFAIIDGGRVNEGDRVGDATVEAIQQDGVMLSWRGRHIRLPIR